MVTHPRPATQPRPIPQPRPALLALPREIRQRILYSILSDKDLLITSITALIWMAEEYGRVHGSVMADMIWVVGAWIQRKNYLNRKLLHTDADTRLLIEEVRRDLGARAKLRRRVVEDKVGRAESQPWRGASLTPPVPQVKAKEQKKTPEDGKPKVVGFLSLRDWDSRLMFRDYREGLLRDRSTAAAAATSRFIRRRSSLQHR
ncbi:hypothetical protein EJ06DRAFT_530245 [Trichodelitschia bisporula]|uniref:Uncharacterized protein n=1 Tax=Trichodelitschia bisporula TaxID=703511 RepID=A0A6G1HW18_9PEZI|nr:hypothetical protein EJ06DRAFT_530245 [Trichodelitschia bisporula]